MPALCIVFHMLSILSCHFAQYISGRPGVKVSIDDCARYMVECKKNETPRAGFSTAN